jgi:hypothetical protein
LGNNDIEPCRRTSIQLCDHPATSLGLRWAIATRPFAIFSQKQIDLTKSSSQRLGQASYDNDLIIIRFGSLCGLA